MFTSCTRASVVYENVCATCNPEAGAKELGSIKDDVPTLYVGESSRTIFERAREHWKDVSNKPDKSHMAKHQQLVHEGAAPEFVMRAVGFYRTALSRQIGEAVRIMRRGGEGMVLNSKSEFDRCKIPRLQLEQIDEEELRSMGEQELMEDLNTLEEHSRKWSSRKYEERKKKDNARVWSRETRSNVREQEDDDSQEKKRAKKKRKFVLMEENWGETRGEEQKLEEVEEQPKDNGEPIPPSNSLPIPPPPPTPLPPPELIAIGVEQNRGEEQQNCQGEQLQYT